MLDKHRWYSEVLPKLSPLAAVVLYHQLFHCAGKDLQHWHSLHTMAVATGLSDKSVQRAQRELEDIGIIQRTPRWHPENGTRQSSIVTICAH